MENGNLKTLRFNKMVEEIEDYAILLLDIDGIIENWNKGAEKIHGFTAEEIIGKNFSIFYLEEDRANNHAHSLIKIAAQKGSASDDGWRLRKDGTMFWASILITAIHDLDRNVIGYTNVTKDLTVFKAHEEQLRLSELRYTNMIAEIQDYAIILLDRKGIIQNWNLGAEKIKGYSSREILGQNFQIFYPEEDRQDGLPLRLLEEATDKGRAYHEGWRVRKNGEKFWGSVTITALHDSNKKSIGFTKVTKDLTDKKLAEEVRQKYVNQLEHRTKEMEQLAYITSHDLQEPLRIISSYISLFENKYESLVDEEAKMFIDVMKRSSQRMRDLIKGILNYFVLGVNKEITLIDCNELLEDVKTELMASINFSEATIDYSTLPFITGYRTELRLLFQNLISNAIKFKKDNIKPLIKIEVKKEQDNWLFSVDDNGIGMDSRFIGKIFLIFQRLHPREAYPGTGMGLAYAKKIVELHNGSIWVKSVVEQGTTFYFTLSRQVKINS